MQNVTIAMDEALVRLTEVEAAKAGKSLSDFISDIVLREMAHAASTPDEENPQLAALQRVFAEPLLPISDNGLLPSSEERNARR